MPSFKRPEPPRSAEWHAEQIGRLLQQVEDEHNEKMASGVELRRILADEDNYSAPEGSNLGPPQVFDKSYDVARRLNAQAEHYEKTVALRPLDGGDLSEWQRTGRGSNLGPPQVFDKSYDVARRL
jgi:hypothetical protein